MQRITCITIIVVFFCVLSVAFAESEGERLFKINRPSEAVLFLEREIASGTASPDAYNYLGLAYYQTGQFAQSITAFEKGLAVSGTDKKVLAYNAGNAAFASRDYTLADSYYSLALAASPGFTKALLNRANARLNASNFSGALEDYVLYLERERNDPQQSEIRRIITLLRGEIVRQEEEARIAAERERQRKEEEARLRAEQERIAAERARQEAAARAEQERIAAERERQRKEEEERLRAEQERIAAEKARQEAAARAAEEERRRKLLEEVANSLHGTNTENMTSGAEDSLDYESEPELD
ncbi:MAG: tetratricopeptide repeat protein [Treponema sp.]|nr:tetratricopeptide repeat protein [Treponema sp.]